MAAADYTEKTVMTEVLKLYKEHRCLWDTSHVLYGNKGVKELALDVILEKFKVLVPQANVDTLKKRINIMRTSYKRECKKVIRNKKHVPYLWYFHLMKFLDKRCKPITKTSISCSQDEASSQNISTETYQPSPSKRPKARVEEVTEYIIIPEESIASKPENEGAETIAFGTTIGLQLRDLGPMQKAIAEKLIADIIFYARLDALTSSTKFKNVKV